MATFLSFDDNLKGVAWFDPALFPETWFHREIEFTGIAPPTLVQREIVRVQEDDRTFLVPRDIRKVESD